MTARCRGRAAPRRRAPLLAALELVLAAGTSACAGTGGAVVLNLAATNDVSSSRYEGVLDRWTRHDSVLFRFDTALDASATFRSAEYRAAYVAYRAQLYGLAPNERAALEQAEEAGERDYAEIHLALNATHESWTDLEAAMPVWRVTFVDSQGHKVQPTKVAPDLTPPAVLGAFFPYNNAFTRTYLLDFARALPDGTRLLAEGTQWFGLDFDGPLGHLELRWKVGRS